MEDHCVMCGEIIPEGRQVCPLCEKKYGGSDDSESQAAFLMPRAKYKRKPAQDHKEGSG